MDIQTRLAKAKTSLMLEYPFWGTLVMNMPFKITDAVPTAATDGKQVLFNPEFCDKQNDEELSPASDVSQVQRSHKANK